VAAGRALSEGEYHATIYDVVVDPEYQRLGIGSRVMSELLARLPVWRGLLVADRKVQPFYRRLGFESYDDVWPPRSIKLL
jgi:ribosomal protein S18 acetylase RimI-like enzyme